MDDQRDNTTLAVLVQRIVTLERDFEKLEKKQEKDHGSLKSYVDAIKVEIMAMIKDIAWPVKALGLSVAGILLTAATRALGIGQ